MKQHQRTRYLEKRGDGFYWRRRLPKIRNYQTNLFLTFSLRTDIPSNARDLAARLTALTTLAFDYAKGCYDLKLDMLRPLLTDLIRFEIAAFEKTRLSEGQRSLAAAELAAQREKAIQETLREAIFLRDWEVMRAPLEAVARRLGVAVPEGGEPWAALALEALRVGIDISQERVRRDRGVYTEQSAFFSRAMRSDVSAAEATSDIITPKISLDTAFSLGSDQTSEPSVTVLPHALAKTEAQTTHAPVGDISAVEQGRAQHRPENSVRQILKARNLLKYCSETSIAALEKGEDITVEEAFDVYFDFKQHGCTDEWEKKQKPFHDPSGKWKNSSGPRVIPPFLMGPSRRIQAAAFSFMAGVMPPMPMLGRSLL